MIRTIKYTVSDDFKSVSPASKQWAGMQFEDNATTVAFVIPSTADNDILWRIDFDSPSSGYDPSENLTVKNGEVSRSLPYKMTRYGGEVQVALVGTTVNSDNKAVKVVYSIPVVLYFTDVEQHDEGAAAENISAAEKSAIQAASFAESAAEKAKASADDAKDSVSKATAAKDKAIIAANEATEKVSLLASNGLTRKIADKLPSVTNANETTLYMVKNNGNPEQNIYDEYMLIDGVLKNIGSTAVDLSDYAMKAELVGEKTTAGGEIFNDYENNVAFEKYAHAEGHNTQAIGYASHTEGNGTIANETNAHAEGKDTRAAGYASHAEGGQTVAEGYCSHAEGNYSEASANYSHAEGYKTKVSGNCAHAEGIETSASGQYSHVEGGQTTASGNYSHAEGKDTRASEHAAHAEGNNTQAIGYASHTEGNGTIANETNAHAEGKDTQAAGYASHAEGSKTIAAGYGAHAEGFKTRIDTIYGHVQGCNNTDYTADKANGFLHVVGNGYVDESTGETVKRDAHVIHKAGWGFFDQGIRGTLADYAEFFEWQDGNPEAEDRIGLIVTLDSDKIKLAKSGDEVLGIVSGTALVIGDDYETSWSKKFLTDDFGRIIYKDIEQFIEVAVESEYNKEPVLEKRSMGFEKCPIVNPEYDPEQPYINRHDRQEWDVIGMLGKLYVRDDGTAQVNGYVSAGADGIATASDIKTNMRVLCRVNDNVIRVLLK